ncbi:thrombospondin type 3 repeat-containing protein [Cerasicoccus maritimus]|uniref:thrombospondin type 3 repeat-containing protein n=1 Tax=Cerasicoccus maritimus TaxID=490089 RepID=UPI00285294B0|nr:hypothetical protein [Cerasicoccus maritimus]
MRRAGSTKLAGCFAACLIFNAASGQTVLPFEADFESVDGYTVGAFSTDAYWNVEKGSPEISDQDSASGQQALFFSLIDTPHRIEASFTGQQGSVMFVDFYIKPEAGEIDDLPTGRFTGVSAQTGFVRVDDKGEVVAKDGDGLGEGEWLYSGEQYLLFEGTSEQWHRFTYRLDYATKTWDLFLDEQLILADLGFLDASLLSFSSFRISTDGNANLGFDFFYAGEVNPLFLDLDLDGIPDAYEIDHGMDPTRDDRNWDIDFDSLSNLTEYLSGTNAGNPDSDGDGVSDSVELANGSNPLSPDEYLLSIIPFLDGFEGYNIGPLVETDVWHVSQGALPVVQSGSSIEGDKSLLLAASEEPLVLQNSFTAEHYQTVWVDFQLKASGFESPPELTANSAVAYCFNDAGQLMVFDGDWHEGGQWLLLEHGAISLGEWVRLTTRLDYQTQTWSVWLNGVRVGEGLGFANPSPFFSQLRIGSNPGGNQTSLDAVSVGYSEPVGLDNDGDGLLNSEEDINGNGLVDVGETDPNLADTDGDGLDDSQGVHLRLWLSADSGVQLDESGRVISWNDLAAGDNALQGSESSKPVFTAGAFNGQSAITFDGIDDFLSGNASYDVSSSDYTIVVVQRKLGGHELAASLSYSTTTSATGAPLVRWGPDWGFLGINDVGVSSDGIYADLGVAAEDEVQIVSVRRSGGVNGNGGDLSLRVLTDSQGYAADGVQNWTSQVASGFYLGKKRPSSDHFFGGEIYEVRVYDSALSDDQLGTLECLLGYELGIEVDRDLDGLPDGWELETFESLAYGALDDPDGDGVNNLREKNLGTNANVADESDSIQRHPALRLWLDASSGLSLDVNGFVAQWEDLSGWDDYAEQPEVSSRPTVLESFYGEHPAVSFDGVDDFLEGVSQFDASAGDFTIIAVTRQEADNGLSASFSYSTSDVALGAPLLRWNRPDLGDVGINDVGRSVSGGFVALNPATTNDIQLVSITRSGGDGYGVNATLAVRALSHMSTLESTAVQTWESGASEFYFLGKKKTTEDGNNDLLSGQIAEVLVFDRVLDQSELRALEESLGAKYQIALDVDADGLEDSLEYELFGSLDESANSDFDGDGLSNQRELALGMLPNVADDLGPVLSVPTLAVWLKAGVGVNEDENGFVDSWVDSSGYDVQAIAETSASRPQKIAPSLNTQPVIQFDGVDDYLLGDAGFDPGLEDFSMIIVQRRTGGHDKAAVISFNQDSSITGAPLLRFGPEDNHIGINDVGVGATGLYQDLEASYLDRYWISVVSRTGGNAGNGGSISLWNMGYNGYLEQTGEQTWSSGSSSIFGLGRKSAASTHYFGGDIAEVIVLKSSISSSEFSQIKQYLESKYALGQDLDGDGLTNSQEDVNLNGIVDPGETDPLNSDTDGDKLNDGLEGVYGLNPLLANDEVGTLLDDGADSFAWRASFDLVDNYFTGPLNGQLYWTANAVMVSGDQDALLTSSENTSASMQHIMGADGHPRVWLSFRAKLIPGTLPSPESITGPTAGLFGYTSENVLNVYDPEVAEWIKVNVSTSASDWNDYDAYFDYEAKEWLLCINGIPIVQGIPFVDVDLTAFSRLRISQAGDADQSEEKTAVVDSIVVSTDEPAGIDFDGDGLTNELERSLGSDVWSTDSDGDGMPDAWEYQYGLDLSVDDADQDLDGEGLSNATELLLGSDPSLEDMDGDDWSDFDEYHAQTSLFDENDHPDAIGLPEPWQMTAIGGTGVPMVWQVGDSWRLAGSGNGDRGAFFYCDIESNFSMTFRVDSLEGEQSNSTLAFTLRESTDRYSPYITAEYRKNGGYYRRYRKPYTGDRDLFRRQPDGVSVPGLLMRMQRTNTGTTISFSNDGVLWREIVTAADSYPNADDTLIGLLLHAEDSKNLDNYARASVELIEFRLDTDNDGLYDEEEIALGTDPLLADTDEDGVSDYDEVYYAHSDPLNRAAPDWQSYLAVGLSQATALKGKWNTNVFGEMQIGDISGKIGISFSLPEAGIYQLRVPVRYIFEGQYNARRSLVIHHYIDGEFVRTTDHVQSISDGVYVLEIYLPYLAAGEHTYQLHWDNVYDDRWISLSGIELAKPTGLSEEDYDAWLARYIGSSESLESETSYSAVSPAFIEGRTCYLSMMHLSDGTLVARAPGDAWFADVNLPSDGSPLNLDIDFQNGGTTVNTTLNWVATNVLADGDIALRAGDSLRLTAGGNPDGTAISIDVDGSVYNTTDDAPVIHQFNEPGEVVISATRGLESGSVTVTVYPRTVLTDAPALTRNYIRKWKWKGLYGLTADSGDVDMDLLTDDGTDAVFELYRTEVIRPRVLAARIGEDGPIAQIVNTDGFWLRENVEGYYAEEFFEEGVYLATSHLICSPLPDDVTLQIRIFKAGVMFEDGSVELTLSNDDLDEFGRYDLVMFKPTEVSGSVCHHIRVYENGEYIHLR